MTIESYAAELPPELRRVISALNSDLGLATFMCLYKYGELSFSDIMSELEIEAKDSSKLVYHLTRLQKAALVHNVYIKKDDSQEYSYYDVTEFGESVLSNLMRSIEIKKEE